MQGAAGFRRTKRRAQRPAMRARQPYRHRGQLLNWPVTGAPCCGDDAADSPQEALNALEQQVLRGSAGGMLTRACARRAARRRAASSVSPCSRVDVLTCLNRCARRLRPAQSRLPCLRVTVCCDCMTSIPTTISGNATRVNRSGTRRSGHG
jgi:hypothetical protein